MFDVSALDEAQREAVMHDGGPLVVFAGAGSGKTRVITYRIARLVAEGVPPWRILAVTFTNKAAEEMRARVGRLLESDASGLWIGTFHSASARLLRRIADRLGLRPDFVIYDAEDSEALVARLVREDGLDERRFDPRRIATFIARCKDEVRGPDAIETRGPDGEVLRRLYTRYEERLALAGALDFGDLIARLVRALEADAELRAEWSARFEHVLVDEYQDTNHAQFRLVRALVPAEGNLCVVGDDDQSIYRWRGADRRHLLEVRRHWPRAHVVKLERNYRSTARIVRAAHAVISRNVDREPKSMWTSNADGARVLVVGCDDDRDEARVVVSGIAQARGKGRSYGEMAIFYRTHAQSRVLEEALRAAAIPYRVVGGMRFYDRAEVRDLVAYLRVLVWPDDDIALRRIVNVPSRKIGATTLDRLAEAAARRGGSLWSVLRDPDAVDLGAAMAQRVGAFVELVEGLRARLREGERPSVLARLVLERTGYEAELRARDDAESDARLANLEELVGSMQRFEQESAEPTVARWLESIALYQSADDSAGRDHVSLMTVHAAKGLEFPIVFVAGLEEDVFPVAARADVDPDEHLEEERRLAYVAFTRAREQLVLSWAAQRFVHGQLRTGRPSRFLEELPDDDVERIGLSEARVQTHARRGFEEAMSSPSAARYTHVRRAGSNRAEQAWLDRDGADPSPGDDSGGLRRGMRVRHARYGVGTIRELVGGQPPRVRVEFPGLPVKTILAGWLEPL
ncbi:MAG: UvrD-helicase domain-containing protein [Myxococcales bacterium]|nr:UvrD-helicase domain-containing protein [Myxococcales bacterium]